MATILIDGDGLVRASRSIVDRCHIQSQGIGILAIVGTVTDLEADGGVVVAIGIECSGVAQFSGCDIGGGDFLIQGHWRPIRTVSAVFQGARALQRGDLDLGYERIFNVSIRAKII